MGPVENEGASGHKKKISAMAVHQLQSCMDSIHNTKDIIYVLQ